MNIWQCCNCGIQCEQHVGLSKMAAATNSTSLQLETIENGSSSKEIVSVNRPTCSELVFNYFLRFSGRFNGSTSDR